MCHDIKQLRLRLYTIQLTPENAEKLPFICINAKKVVSLCAKYRFYIKLILFSIVNISI